MKNLKQYITESLIFERSLLDQPDWGEIDDIKYLSRAANKMEKIGSMDLKKIIHDNNNTQEYFSIYSSMIHCFQDIIDNCLDSNDISEEVQEELGTFADFEKFKMTGYYEKVSDSFYNDYEGDADDYIKVICKYWNDICKKATGVYWW